jgi:hypothetical protein
MVRSRHTYGALEVSWLLQDRVHNSRDGVFREKMVP